MIGKPTSSTARKEASPDPSEGRGDKFASILQKLSEKRVKALSSRVRIGTPPLYFPSVSDRWFGEAGWGFLWILCTF